jgi:hypothetical protein
MGVRQLPADVDAEIHEQAPTVTVRPGEATALIESARARDRSVKPTRAQLLQRPYESVIIVAAAVEIDASVECLKRVSQIITDLTGKEPVRIQPSSQDMRRRIVRALQQSAQPIAPFTIERPPEPVPAEPTPGFEPRHREIGSFRDHGEGRAEVGEARVEPFQPRALAQNQMAIGLGAHSTVQHRNIG